MIAWKLQYLETVETHSIILYDYEGMIVPIKIKIKISDPNSFIILNDQNL